MVGVLGGKKHGTLNTFLTPGPLTGMMGAAATAGGGKIGPEATQKQFNHDCVFETKLSHIQETGEIL